MDKVAKQEFYQSKFEYYRTLIKWAVVASSLASTTYWISDCQLFGRVAWETLLPRTFILIPMCIFIYINARVHNYKIVVPFAFLIFHGIMWCTIWAIYYLPIKQHANEGFIIMHLMFLVMGICAPFKYSLIAHSLVIANIFVSNFFNHYESIEQMYMLGIPCVVAICFIDHIMEQVYRDNYDMKRELERFLIMDRLTQVYNRNIFKSICEEDCKHLHIGENEDICVLMMDVDFFKKVNDTYGHMAGDKVLQVYAQTIQSCVSEKDYVVRWGGEEFVVLLPGYSLEQGIAKAEEIRKTVNAKDNSVCPITISIGVTMYDGKNYLDTIDNADNALYQAKQKGRNCVVVFEK